MSQQSAAALSFVPQQPASPSTTTSRSTPQAVPATWPELLAAQDGVIARWQALGTGMSRKAWQWRCAHTWQVPVRGVAVTHTGPLTDGERLWVAVLACGAGAAVSGDWALVAAGLHLRPPRDVHVAVPTERRVERRRLQHVSGDDLVRPHRVAGLAVLVHPASAPARVRVAPAALHAAAWAVSDRAAEWRVAAVVQQRLTTPEALRQSLAAMPRLPRQRLLSRVLDDVEFGAHAQTELDFLALLDRNGLPRPDRMQAQVRAHGLHYLDACWNRQRVVAEIDGAHHREVATWDADTLRSNEIVVRHRAERVVLLRLTGGNLRHDEPAVVQQLRAVLL